jgi:hypothetical protein
LADPAALADPATLADLAAWAAEGSWGIQYPWGRSGPVEKALVVGQPWGQTQWVLLEELAVVEEEPAAELVVVADLASGPAGEPEPESSQEKKRASVAVAERLA